MQNTTTTTNSVSETTKSTLSALIDLSLSGMAVERQTGETLVTSLEIADMTGKRHNHVMRDIRRMIEDLEIPEPISSTFVNSYTDSTGRSLPCFHLPFDLAMTLLTGYDAELRECILRRWVSLETKRFRAIQKELAETQGLEDRVSGKDQLSHAIFTLGQPVSYATIGCMASKYPDREFSEHLLMKASESLGVAVIRSNDDDLDTEYAYHTEAWFAVYGLDSNPSIYDRVIDEDDIIQDEL